MKGFGLCFNCDSSEINKAQKIQRKGWLITNNLSFWSVIVDFQNSGSVEISITKIVEGFVGFMKGIGGDI